MYHIERRLDPRDNWFTLLRYDGGQDRPYEYVTPAEAQQHINDLQTTIAPMWSFRIVNIGDRPGEVATFPALAR